MNHAPIIVVGASKGVGRSIAEQLIARGRPVITVSRTGEPLAGVVQHIHADVVSDGLPIAELPEALAGMVYAPGSIDLKPLRSLKPEDLRTAFEVNVVGAFRCAQATADRLKRVPGSSMLFFSTVAVAQGMPFHVSVAAAKGGVEGLVRSLAAELAPTVRVNAIAPSLTDTSLAERLLNSPEKAKAAADRHPLKRVGSADELAAMGVFLLSEEAGWITGQVIGVDGGMSRLR